MNKPPVEKRPFGTIIGVIQGIPLHKEEQFNREVVKCLAKDTPFNYLLRETRRRSEERAEPNVIVKFALMSSPYLMLATLHAK